MKIISMILGFILVSFFIASCSLNNDSNIVNNDSELEDTQINESEIDEVIEEEFIDEEEFLSEDYNEFGSMI